MNFKQLTNEGDVVAFPKKHRGDLSSVDDCPKCGGDLQGGKYQGHEVKVCMPCKQVYLPPNSGIDQQGNPIKEAGVAEGADERKRNAMWAQITSYEKRAKETKNDIKKDHLMKMASELRAKLPTTDEQKLDETLNDLAEAMGADLNEFAPANNPGGGNYLKALASAWYNDTFNTGDLHKGIKSQEDVERILERGIHCGDGKIRKYSIGYNSNFDGVEIQSDDHYEYSDNDDAGNDIDSRTGKPWGPYDVVAFAGNELDESVAEGNKKPEQPEADYGDEYQAMVKRMKQLAGAGPLKTVYDPAKRVYKNIPTAVQPKK
jgi:hypothetical protein